MPGRPAKVCTRAGCNVLISDGTSRCPKHKKKNWERRPDITPRRRGEWLTKERKKLFAKQPLCVYCLQKDPEVIRIAVIRDHIIPLEEGGAEEADNTQPLCKECHDIKSQQEAYRGKNS